MTQSESPKIVKKKLFSPVWLLPIVALVLAAWLGYKSVKEAGVEIQIHFPNAAGIEIGKTLVKYQGLTVGKVTDISLDDDLVGVNVRVLMDYRSEPFLNESSQFWLVKPKASITGIEGLDTLFSGNYIAVQPGEGKATTDFVAKQSAPAILPGSRGMVISLKADKLGSLDVGSPLFFRQIPVGNVVSFHLQDDKTIIINSFIEDQYAHLVKQDSRFWNVSGLKVDASLSGISVNTESIASILAGGISFSSGDGEQATYGDQYQLYDSQELAIDGIELKFKIDTGDDVSKGTQIVYRGLTVGEVTQVTLDGDKVAVDAKLEQEYQGLLTADSQFWLAGAHISLDEVKHLSRLVTGHVINILPGNSKESLPAYFELQAEQPDLLLADKLPLTLSADIHTGVSVGAQIRYKQLPIGEVLDIALSDDFNKVSYQIEIYPEYKKLLTQGSYFVHEAALDIKASLDEVSVKTRDINTFMKGAISLIPSFKGESVQANAQMKLYESGDVAQDEFRLAKMHKLSLSANNGADLSVDSPIYYKKMVIGHINRIDWIAEQDSFEFELAIEPKYKKLINERTVFWRNNALSVNASLAGVEVDVAPLAGAIKGSISLGMIDEGIEVQPSAKGLLYEDKQLAMRQAQLVTLTVPASVKLNDNAAIRYQGHQIGFVKQVKLQSDLAFIQANAYLYGEYADHFSKSDSEYYIVDASISLAGIEAPDTLITGPYLGVLPGSADTKARSFKVNLESKFDSHRPSGSVDFVLKDEQLGSIKQGTPVFYRGIAIGQIDGYQLSSSGSHVEIFGHIEKEYTFLINQSSKFWDASGIKLEVGLFSGAQIETGSLETLLAGGISVVTEEITTDNNKLTSGSRFILHHKMNKEWQDWSPEQQR
ncbi:MCE family protein [Shewanella maritima]|uniref:MCE family protein n=1 Tax=Shewanella maritima TaxID=2520507 RepID=A0A411PM29_9GAMM|nr:MlaD family protein [Shewanella maritima]QBF84569.1 MCE family protein [Shewanella maritima]